MSYARLAAKVYSSQWAIQPSMLASILTVLHSRMAGDPVSPDFVGKKRDRRFAITGYDGLVKRSEYDDGQPDKPAPDPVQTTKEAASTVVIFGSGILGKHLSAMDEDCAGGLSVDRIQAALTSAAADAAIKNIVLWLDTPGGVVTGIPETADLVSEICKTKNVVAYCDSLCASAGYWIASACDYIYATRSADLGSVGVYSALFDLSALYAKEGVKVELFKDGIYKAAGFPGTSLTEEQRAEIQASVMETSAAFKADVKKYRPQLADATLQGQCLTGPSAVAAGLADALVNSLDEVLADLSKL